MKKNNVITIVILACLVLVFGLAMFGINFYTAPIIKQKSQGSALKELTEVLPEGSDFEQIYDSENPDGYYVVVDADSPVTAIYKETNGKGFVFKVSTASQYSKSNLEYTVGVSAEGNITGVTVTNYDETQDFKDYPQTYVGQNSTLADVGMYAGVTYSSTAFKEGVIAGFKALSENNLLAEAKKGDDQVLTELVASKHSGLQNEGNLKVSEMTVSGDVVKAMKGLNESGYAVIVKDGDTMVLVILNNMNGAKVYDVEGNDVTSEKTSQIETAKAIMESNDANNNKLKAKIKSWYGVEEVTALTVDAYNTVVSAYSFVSEGTTYYAYYSRSFGFNDMDVYYVLDGDGKICKFIAENYVFEQDYFQAFKTNNPGWTAAQYTENFIGKDETTFDESAIVITSATMSTNAFKTSTNDVFAAFKATVK